MFEKKVSVEMLVAYALWVLGSAIILIAIIYQLNGVAPGGLAIVMAGCMVDLHGMFDRLERREVKAFELGRRLTSLSERDRV